MLELGPGPGVTTECLHDLGADLTCVEIHTGYATSIARRMPNDRVQVLAGDASVMPLADASFDTVVCFTMLHHLPSKILQDRVLAEVLRVLVEAESIRSAAVDLNLHHSTLQAKHRQLCDLLSYDPRTPGGRARYIIAEILHRLRPDQ